MDILYTGDIPKDYKYIYLEDGYIYLFNKLYAEDESVNCYKIDNKNGFLYCHDTFVAQSLVNFEEVQVTDKHYYRTDFPNILLTSCLFGLILVFITNIITSFFKRGGVFSELF